MNLFIVWYALALGGLDGCTCAAAPFLAERRSREAHDAHRPLRADEDLDHGRGAIIESERLGAVPAASQVQRHQARLRHTTPASRPVGESR